MKVIIQIEEDELRKIVRDVVKDVIFRIKFSIELPIGGSNKIEMDDALIDLVYSKHFNIQLK